MKKLALSKAVFILPVFLLIVSCHKDLIKEGLHVKVQGKDAPNYYFNWETARVCRYLHPRPCNPLCLGKVNQGPI